MPSRRVLRLSTATALAVTLALLPSFSNAAGDRLVATTAFSAEKEKKKEEKKQKRVQEQQHKEMRQELRQEHKGQRKAQEQQHKELRQELRQEQKEIRQEKRKVFNPRGPNAHVVTAVKIRSIPAHGRGQFAIRGHNYSVWREGYRVRYHNGWRTFVALSALGVLAVGAATYYPYAYIEAPRPFCEGLTDDGCYLDWDEVETIEGDLIGQCVAYCPWQ